MIRSELPMTLKNTITKSILMKIGVPRILGMIDNQKSIVAQPGSFVSTSNSPTRFEIPLEAAKMIRERDDFEMQHTFPMRRMFSIMKNINVSVNSISKNPSEPLIEVSEEFLDNLREFAYSLGVGPIGFTKLPRDLIFQGFGVKFDNAIVLAMEMDEEKICKAPSQETMNMVFGTYDNLGIAANRVAAYLREQGYAAQADHPLGGLVLFPPLAQIARIGWVGKHGLLITPEYGPRVRLATVYTSIQNLPFTGGNVHGWIDDYCKICGLCIKQCPTNAILDEPIVQQTGLVTHIKQRACFEYFAQFYGCSVCIKACPFSQTGDTYERLKAVIERKR
jgi:epoxyqueuosine reductase